jgi:DNA-binding protein H-NS
MAKQNLTSMTVDALLKLRDEIAAVLSRKADDLKNELSAIGADYADVGRIALYGKKSLNGRKKIGKAPVKYRHPKTKETWAGRGAMAGWLKAELKAGKKREDFLVGKLARKAAKKKVAKKRGRPAKKRVVARKVRAKKVAAAEAATAS